MVDRFARAAAWHKAAMADRTASAQERVYEEDAANYDLLISAEDADGELPRALTGLLGERGAGFAGARVADIGAGTARLTRVVAERAAHVDLVDRAGPMLEVGRGRLEKLGRTNFQVHQADARALPLASGAYDIAMAGWVFGHFRHWMPEGWKDEVSAALGEMRRILRPGGHLFVIETLGTGHETPRQHPALDEYFAYLEQVEGLTRTWIRTDYAFADPETAAAITGRFFGEAFADKVRAEGWSRVPECTAIFHGTT